MKSTRALPTLRAQLIKIVVTLVATAAMVVGLGAFALWAFNPVGDEWDCSPGEFPATNIDGGKACFANGEVPPDGWSADPEGNQPF